LILCTLARTAQGIDPTVHISQYAHMAWRVQDGFFTGAPTAIAQTKDGYLWVGTPNGVFQFDGVQFSRWNPGQKNLQDASTYSFHSKQIAFCSGRSFIS
jgi:ligand-binding sensor domain-containing protein